VEDGDDSNSFVFDQKANDVRKPPDQRLSNSLKNWGVRFRLMRNAFRRIIDAFHEFRAQTCALLLLPLESFQQIGLRFRFD
jgi:hypothetical protein